MGIATAVFLYKMREKQEGEMEVLREKTVAQEQQLNDVSQKADVLIQQQEQLQRGFVEQQQQTHHQYAHPGT